MTKSGPAQGSICRALGQPCTDSTLGTGGSLASFTVTPIPRMQRNWSVEKMLGYTRLGLKKVEASKGQPMVLPE